MVAMTIMRMVQVPADDKVVVVLAVVPTRARLGILLVRGIISGIRRSSPHGGIALRRSAWVTAIFSISAGSMLSLRPRPD
jgi:hypothetical protein